MCRIRLMTMMNQHFSSRHQRIFSQLSHIPVSHSNSPAQSLKSLLVSGMASPCRSFSQPRTIPSTGFQMIDPSSLIEEERIPNYRARRYYLTSIGEAVNTRYQVVGKLNYGFSSTVWLCRDLKYVVHSTQYVYL